MSVCKSTGGGGGGRCFCSDRQASGLQASFKQVITSHMKASHIHKKHLILGLMNRQV